MRISKVISALVLALAVASTAAAAQQVSASALAKLEQERTRRPNDVRAHRALGVAYYKNGRFQDARTTLERARALDQRDGVAALYLGLSAERLNDLTAAKNAYTSYLAVGKSGRAKRDVENRLAAISELELRASARAAMAREQQLSTQRGPLTTIAVLPFNFEGADSSLAPLGRGLADLVVSDLSIVTPQLTLLERGRVQVLLDEIALGQTARVDLATAARSGRMLQAGRLVIGSIQQAGQNISVTAPTYTMPQGTAAPQAGNSMARATFPLGEIFDLEKELVGEILVDLGITPTPQQRVALTRRPTQNVQAFLAYSRGLVASDAGRLEEAANFFDNARSLDPGFGAAAARATQSRAALQGQAVTPAIIEAGVSGTEGQVVSAAERGSLASARDAIGSTLANAIADINPSPADALARTRTQASTRDPVAATTGSDQTGRTGTVVIVIRRQ